MEVIKSVEKAFLRLFFATNELNIINQKNIHFSMVITKLMRLFIPDSTNKIVSELFRAKVPGCFS
jgi:hypothetical protein